MLLLSAACLTAQTREDVLAALRKAGEFYRNKVSTQGGYHFYYAEDLSYGRSEQSEGPTTVENQREATPIVGMTFLEAWDATGDRFYLEAARAAAMALVRGQHCSGGWDYFIEFDPAKRKAYPYRSDGNCGAVKRPASAAEWSQPYTTLDDNTTQACLRLMMRTDRALEFKDAAIHEAARYALDKLMQAQYPNGAWPQRFYEPPDAARFPVRKAAYPDSWPRTWPGPNYRHLYTFNDNSISDMIDTLLEAARIYKEPRYRAAAERGGDFMLLAQMPDPQPAWAQQYDVDMHPAWARAFEPPSVTGGESQGVMKSLLVLYQETGKRKYLDAVPRALEYLKRSALPPADHAVEARSRMPQGAPVLARFYELKTNRPLYITKGTRVSVDGRPTVLMDGYQLSYTDESVITHYNVLVSGDQLPLLEAEHQRLVSADAASIRRPDKLHGLSPWSEYPLAGARPAQFPPRSTADAREQAARGPRRRRPASVPDILAAMDSRGAWVEEGSIGKADKIVSVFAAKDMVVQIGKQTLPLKENETLDVFQGTVPPRERIIRSQTFARNIEALLAWLRAHPK
jgi:hypothetical protein